MIKKEKLWLLLVAKIPADAKEQREILDTLVEICRKGDLKDYLILLRASYMTIRDMKDRKAFYLALAPLLAEHLKQRSELATGPHGLYIGFIAEDLGKTKDEELVQAGRTIALAQRLATAPPEIDLCPRNLPVLSIPDMPPARAQADPAGWIALLLKQESLFSTGDLAKVRPRLAANPETLSARERARALLVVGAHLEDPPRTPWALGCYWAATAIDPSFDLPWAFLSHYADKPHDGLALANQAICANPKSLPGLIHRGSLLSRLGRFDEALRDFAEVARYEPDSPRSLMMSAHAAMDAGQLELAARLFRFAQKSFPALPEPWFGLGRMFWKAGLPEPAKACQERFRVLRHGNVPRDLLLPGRIRVHAPQPGIRVTVDGTQTGGCPIELPSVLPGEHRLTWDGGPSRRVMVDEGECVQVTWLGAAEEVQTESYVPDPMPLAVGGEAYPGQTKSAREVLSPFLQGNLDAMPVDARLEEILTQVRVPLCPYPPDTRLTVEWVFEILLEEILADGLFDQAENEVLRAVRDRLRLEPETFDRLLENARRQVEGRQGPGAGTLNPPALYRRLLVKGLEDGILEESERRLLQTVAEALLIQPEEIAEIERGLPGRE